jgi:hypothetical protein
LASAEYRAAFDEIRSVGAVDSTTRTPEQTEIALYWEDVPGRTSTPPGHWNQIAHTVAEARGNTLAQNARLFALLNLTYGDDAIAFLDSKYTYGFWRAVTAIRETVDPKWLPLITTPAHPSYPCAHCVFSTSGAEVLASFFGTDDVRFSSTSEGTGVTRSYTSFTQAADEAGLSRLYGGIHWRFDINTVNGMGRALARYVTANFLLPLGDSPHGAGPTLPPGHQSTNGRDPTVLVLTVAASQPPLWPTRADAVAGLTAQTVLTVPWLDPHAPGGGQQDLLAQGFERAAARGASGESLDRPFTGLEGGLIPDELAAGPTATGPFDR